MSEEHEAHYCACGCRLPVVVDIAALRYQLAAKSAECERLVKMEKKVRAVVDDMPENECTCGADNGDDLGSGGVETGCYLHELRAALAPRAEKPAGEGE